LTFGLLSCPAVDFVFQELLMSTSSTSENGHAFAKLGQQEKQVLLHLSEGRSDREIARALFLGEGTIRNYMNSILAKLGLSSRVEAPAYALKHNLRGHMGDRD
jgi:DNA-binding NarL/FixJ family response regulator